jgi:class 3 adenylate cyclase
MATNQETLDKLDEYLNASYTQQETRIVPKRTDLTFGNTVKKIPHAVVLYVDMRKSRKILSDATTFWSVKIHRAFLLALTHCVEKRDGHMRSFNGDGIMAFFVGENSASRAVRAAMDTKGFIYRLNESLKSKGLNPIDFGIGIAQGPIMVAKSGKAGDDFTKQDLIWVGLPVYMGVELSDYARSPRNIWISNNVRTSIGKEDYLGVVYDDNGNSKWVKETRNFKSVGEKEVRATSWSFKI